MRKKKFKKLGLVLAGGGGKGAYQVGIFQALLETGLFDKVSVMAGTSVGALNAVQFTHKNLAMCHYLWLSAIEKEIIDFDHKKFGNDLVRWKILFRRFKEEGQSFSSFMDLIKSTHLPLGLFDRDGLMRILRQEIDWSTFMHCNIDIYATATNILTQKPHYFHINQLSNHNIREILLASSAIPGVFNPVLIDDQQYYDGGISDNLPLDVVYESGCDLILTLPLFRSLDRVKNKEKYPNAQIIELVPENSLGGLLGVLDFSPKSARTFMEAGYQEHITLLRAISHIFEYDDAPTEKP